MLCARWTNLWRCHVAVRMIMPERKKRKHLQKVYTVAWNQIQSHVMFSSISPASQCLYELVCCYAGIVNACTCASQPHESHDPVGFVVLAHRDEVQANPQPQRKDKGRVEAEGEHQRSRKRQRPAASLSVKFSAIELKSFHFHRTYLGLKGHPRLGRTPNNEARTESIRHRARVAHFIVKPFTQWAMTKQTLYNTPRHST